MTAFLDDDLYGFDTFTERVMSELEGGDIVNIMPYDDGLYLSFAEDGWVDGEWAWEDDGTPQPQ